MKKATFRELCLEKKVFPLQKIHTLDGEKWNLEDTDTAAALVERIQAFMEELDQLGYADRRQTVRKWLWKAQEAHAASLGAAKADAKLVQSAEDAFEYATGCAAASRDPRAGSSKFWAGQASAWKKIAWNYKKEFGGSDKKSGPPASYLARKRDKAARSRKEYDDKKKK